MKNCEELVLRRRDVVRIGELCPSRLLGEIASALAQSVRQAQPKGTHLRPRFAIQSRPSESISRFKFSSSNVGP